MSKPGSKIGSGNPEFPVGRLVVQIALPLEEASETASAVEDDRGQASGAATPAEVRRERKRKWYSLYDKVYALRNLEQAWEKVQANQGAPGCDGQTVAQFGSDLAANLSDLHEQLREKRYRPRPVRRVEIPKPGGGTRALGIPTVRDRIVQQALLQVMGPIFEAKFSKHSHGFRPGRACRTALCVVDQALRRGYEWVLDADIKQFFDTVDHEVLLDAVNEEISDGSVLKLIRMFLECGVLLEGGEFSETTLGTPQGGPLSPLLANIYLHPLDVALQAGGFGLVRYADDFVIFTKSRERAEEAQGVVERELARLKLHLHPDKTRTAALGEGFDFLGYRFFRDGAGKLRKVVSKKAVRRFRDAIRKRTKRHAGQKRPQPNRCTVQRLRGNPQVQGMVASLNRYLVSWHGYFRGVCNEWSGYFGDFDGFVRRRVRCAIAGCYAKDSWHQTLSNRVLADIGLTSLEHLHAAAAPRRPTASPNSG